MAKTIYCASCGYSSDEGESTCPICGGHMSGSSRARICDSAKEEEWNSGYHNDFEEGRKTGDYCDRELEKNINGGEHFHNEEHTATAEESNTGYADEIDLRNLTEEDRVKLKTAFLTQLFLCLIPVFGFIRLVSVLSGKSEKKPDHATAIAMVGGSVAGLAVRYAFSIIFSFFD